MKRKIQTLWALALALSVCITTMSFVPIRVAAASGQFATCLSEIANGTDTIGNAPSSTNLRPYAGDTNVLSWIGYTKTDNAIRVKSNGVFDAWNVGGKYNYYAGIDFNLGAVTDIYGANKGVYVYDVDFDLNLSDDDIYASSINDKRRNVFLSFGSGKGLSISGINFFHDRITQSEVHAANKESLLYEGTLENGTYHLRYIFTAGASAAASKITAVLTPPNGGADIVLINDAKLTYMPGEKGESWDTVTETDGTTSLGWMTVGARQALNGSYIEVANATFRAYGFDDWFVDLPTLTNQTLTQITGNATVNNSDYAAFYNEDGVSYRNFSTGTNSVKVSSLMTSHQSEAGRRAYSILKLDQVDDIYGANQGTYLYDVDINLNFTGTDSMAPLSTANGGNTGRRNHCVYLGFFGGMTGDYAVNPSYSVINIFQDSVYQTLERAEGNDCSLLYTFDNNLTNGKYNIRYEYVTGASASAARVNIVLTKYQQNGVSLEATPVMTLYNQKLTKMLAESRETWSAETNASLGWIEVGVRSPYTGTSIEVTRASFGEKPLPTTVDEYFAELPTMAETTATTAIANSYVNVAGVASLDVGDRGAYYNASSVPGALRLISNYRWENNFKRFLLTMRLGDDTNIYGTNKVYRYTADFKLHFNEDTENHYLCRLPGTYTDENDQTDAVRRFIGIFNFGSSTNLLLFRNGMMAHDGVPGATEFDNLLEDGVYTIQILYYAGSDSQESSVSVDLIYKGENGNSEPVVIPCYKKVKTKFMVGEVSEKVAVSTGTLQDLKVGIGGAPTGSYMEITGASLESQIVPDRLTYKSASYSKTGNTLTVTGVYDHDFGYELHPEMLYIQHIGLFSADEKEILVYGNVAESLLGEGDDQNWTVQVNYTGALSAGMKIKLFVWDEENNPLIDDHSLTVE